MSEDLPEPLGVSLPIEQLPPSLPAGAWPTPPVLPVARPPRVWPALVVAIGAFPATVIASAIVFVFYLAFTGGLAHAQVDKDTLAEKTMSTPGGFFALFLPGQLVILFAAVGAAILSPQRVSQRLGMLRPRVPVWSILLMALATPLFGFAGAVLMQAVFKQPSSALKMLSHVASGPTGKFAIVVGLMVSLMPPLAEETMFRGYLQRRLLERWGPIAAIAISTLIFTASHFDPAHMLGVLPLGIWLGVVAWQCGSIWPSMACHATQNSLFMLASRLHNNTEKVTLDASTLIFLGITGASLAASIYAMRRRRRE